MLLLLTRIRRFSVRHWGALLAVLLVAGFAAAIVLVPAVRARAATVWENALRWAGLTGSEESSGQVYWCPMHPQIKRTRPNEVCPICNMALVPLEGNASAEPAAQLTLTPQQMQQAAVVYEPVIRRKLFREIDTTGRVEYDERRLAKITSWVVGKSRIEKLYVDFTGTEVEPGQLLAELYSRELINDQEELRVLLTTSSRLRDERSVDAIKQRLRDQGLTDAQIERLARTGEVQDRIPVYARSGGTVIMRHVQQFDHVSEGDVLFEIADLSQLWVYVDVFEDELPLVSEGQQAEITIRSQPGAAFQGVVAFVPPEIQRDTRTARVRINVPNPERRLKPGMYARVRLRKDLGEQLAVPANGVLWSGQRQVAIVRLGAGTFQPREVRVEPTWAYPLEPGYRPGGQLEFGAERVRYHPVLSGLNPGEAVVTAGAFLLNAESQFQSVLTKMLPPESRSATLDEALGAPVADALRETLDAYYGLVEALAADKLPAVPEWAGALERSATALARAADQTEMPKLVGQAERLAELARALTDSLPADLKTARTGFGRISRQLVALLSEHGGPTLFGSSVFYFRCGMAKVGYENWLWWSSEIHNPYMGPKMLNCGTQLKTLEP